MTTFNFITVGKTIDIVAGDNLGAGQIPQETTVLELGKDKQRTQKFSLKDRLYQLSSQSIQFLQSSNLVPSLPKEVNIAFINIEFFEKLGIHLSKIRGKELPEQYGHLSCVFPETSTIYVSSTYLTQKNHFFKFTDALKALGDEFNHDVQKILDREIYHEIGHLGIRTHLPRKEVQSSMHPFEQRIRNNIEEGFADAFSLHMMALKHGHVEFPVLRAHIFNQVKDDPFQEINLYRIYDQVPFRNADGSLLTDIKKITSKCLDAALNNNKEMLLECLADPYYEPQVKQSLNLNFTGSDNDYVDHFHRQYKKEGIVVNIKNLRSTMLGVNKHDNKNKI